MKYFKTFFSVLLSTIFLLSSDLISSSNIALADTEAPPSPHIVYSSHCQKVGWTEEVTDGTMSGTTGKNYRLEAFTIALEGIGGNVSYRSFVEKTGWQNYVSNGNVSGTEGKALTLIAVQMSLNGEVANTYDIYYQIHKSSIGWTGWVSNGTVLGADSPDKKIEAIQVLLVKKGGKAPSSLSTPSFTPNAFYSAHVQNIGWMDYGYGAGVSGTTGKDLRLEAFKLKLSSSTSNLGIEYTSFVDKIGWQKWVSNDSVSGTEGQRKPIYSVKVRMKGYLGANYDVYYRIYSSENGWTDWSKNGEPCGSPEKKDMLQALQVKVQIKGTTPPSNTILPITSNTPIELVSRTHVQTFGWQNSYGNGEIAGTEGLGKRLEAIRLNFSGIAPDKLGIKYKVHVQTYGWMDWVENGELAGTEGKAKRLEAIKIELTGSMAEEFDIYYRTHCQKLGWLDWAKNGELAGTSDLSYRMEAIQILVVPKNSKAPGSISVPFVSKALRGIDVSRWQGDIDWKSVAEDGIKFAMIRVQYGLTKDKYYQTNLTQARKNGLYTGAYCYSIATNVKEAQAEARALVEAVKGYNVTYPLVFDIEDQYYQANLTTKERMDMVLAFRDIVEENGYHFMLYANKNWMESYLDAKQIEDENIDVWLARYRDESLSFDNPSDKGNDKISFNPNIVKMWQYTSQGTVNGVTGDVDMNLSYKFYD